MVQYRQFKNISLFLSERSLSWNTKKKLAAAATIIRTIIATSITIILTKKIIAGVDTIIRMIILTTIITNILMIILTKTVIAGAAMIIPTNTSTIITDIPTRMADAAVTKKRNRHIITPMTKICCITKKICPTS